MEILQMVTGLVAKLAPLAVEAYEAAQAKDVERHQRAVKAMMAALDEVQGQLADMDSRHQIQLQTALDLVAARFPRG